MGTNFYLGRSRDDSQHIGKRFGAGQGEIGFIFRAYSETDGGPLTTWQQWRAIVLAVGVTIDEYGCEHDARAFVANIEAIPMWARRRQADMLIEEGIPVGVALASPEAQVVACEALGFRDFLDPEGYSFSFAEFS